MFGRFRSRPLSVPALLAVAGLCSTLSVVVLPTPDRPATPAAPAASVAGAPPAREVVEPSPTPEPLRAPSNLDVDAALHNAGAVFSSIESIAP